MKEFLWAEKNTDMGLIPSLHKTPQPYTSLLSSAWGGVQWKEWEIRELENGILVSTSVKLTSKVKC